MLRPRLHAMWGSQSCDAFFWHGEGVTVFHQPRAAYELASFLFFLQMWPSAR